MQANGIFNKFMNSKPVAPPPVKSDIFQQIEKLAELHKSGVLTDEEFQNKKEELLKRL